ncbi:hypothetical protein niasHT_035104 [Heterodera trifolii]|uniref:RNA methyltransferase n=1 Tax=Heterodera trifolii TaxID=157864 RepID=A0ABD2IH87_9BILA
MTKSATADGGGGGTAAASSVHRHQSPQKVPHPPPKKRPAPETVPQSAVTEVPALPGVPPPAKFRKRQSSFYAHVNVRDPLNLGSVKPDNPDDPNFAKPIQLIPTNVNDPLNLQNLSSAPADAEDEALPTAADAQQRRKRKRIRIQQPKDESDEPTTSDDLSSPPPLSTPIAKRRLTCNREQTTTAVAAATVAGDQAASAVVADNATAATVVEVEVNKEAEEEGPGLDIGSNAGHFAISLARAFQPRRVLGVDIDSHLVGAACKNIRHFCDKDTKDSHLHSSSVRLADFPTTGRMLYRTVVKVPSPAWRDEWSFSMRSSFGGSFQINDAFATSVGTDDKQQQTIALDALGVDMDKFLTFLEAISLAKRAYASQIGRLLPKVPTHTFEGLLPFGYRCSACLSRSKFSQNL